MALTKIGSIGINTGIQFAGVTTIATLNASDNVLSVGGTVNFVSDVSIGGTVSIAGTLTYEDVTNVDAVGLITARNGIKVGSGITLSKDGNIFTTGISTFGGQTTINGNVFLNESDPKIFFNDGGSMISNANVANTLAFFSDGSNERVRIHSSGFVGIGTDVPNSYDSGGRTLVLDQRGTLAGMTIRASQQGGIYFADGLSGNEAYRGRIEYKHADDALDFGTSGTASKIRITSDGELLVNTTTVSPHIRLNEKLGVVYAGNYGGASLTNYGGTTAANKPLLDFNRSRGTSNASMTSVASGDGLGHIVFRGADGTNFVDSSAIRADVDDTPGSSDMPGRLVFETTPDGSGTLIERLRIDSSGRVLIGTNTARAVGGESNPRIHIEGSGNTSNSWINFTRFQAGTAGPNFQFAKARSNTPGTYTVVQSGDNLGQISFLGADGTDMANYAALIKAEVDGTAGSNDMPGRLVFATTVDGGTFPTERMRIDSNGHVTKPNQFHIEVSRTDDQTGYNAGGDFGTPMIFTNVVRTIGTTNAALDTSTGKITVPVAGVYFLEAAVVASADSFQQAWFTEGSSRMNYSDHVHAGDTTAYTNRLQTVGMHYLDANTEVGFKPYGSNKNNVTIQDSIYHTWFRVTLMG